VILCTQANAAIEHAKKYTAVFSVLAWRNIFALARQKRPNKVNQLQHSDFLDCKSLCDETINNRTKDENGNIMNWLKIKVLRYEKQNCNTIFYKYRYGDEFTKINIRGRGRQSNIANFATLKACYDAPLPIPTAKKADLLALSRSGVIPKEHHSFFKNLAVSKTSSNDDADEDC